MGTLVLLVLATAAGLLVLTAEADDRRGSLPLIGPISIERFCAKRRVVGLGACSSHYIECSSTTGAHRIADCPIGKVFSSTFETCRPTTEVRECFDFEVNQLNEATESLAKATRFCKRFFGSAIVVPVSNDARCTRQGLLCDGSRPPLAIGCPADQTLGFDLRCVPVKKGCFHVSPDTFAPVRANLISIYCDTAFSSQDGRSTGLQSVSSIYDPSLRCKNWYVTCGARDPEFVFCEPGKVFDRKVRACRRVQPEDKCPLIGSCKGLEWRTIPLGDCRKDFLYCEGLRPRFFQCSDDTVFAGDRCVPYSQAGSECGECLKGDKKKSPNCHNFYNCEFKDGRLRWREYRCKDGYVFDPRTKDCTPPSGYSCPTEVKCQDGQSYSTECTTYFVCWQGRWQVGKCTDGTRWSPKHRRCVRDQSCSTYGGSSGQGCQSGSELPSEDCRYYLQCYNGQYRQVPCQGVQNAACRACSQDWQSSERPGYDNEQYSPRQCVDGERIIDKQDCRQFFECQSGRWIKMACPEGYSYDLKDSRCEFGKQKSCYAGEAGDGGSLYVPSDDTGASGGYVPAIVPEIPKDYQSYYNRSSTFEFCYSNSKPLPIYSDCAKYKECDSGRSYYIEKRCPYGMEFDQSKGECSAGYQCNAECADGSRKPREGCGKAWECRNGKWEPMKCKGNVAFINDRCDPAITCDGYKPEYENGGRCYNEQTKPHPTDCTKYLRCVYGQFTEASCWNGHTYSPKAGRCVSDYECESQYKPNCYDGKTRPVGNDQSKCSSEYEICSEGRWEQQSCPYGQFFDSTTGRCGWKECDGYGNDGSNGGDSGPPGYGEGEQGGYGEGGQQGGYGEGGQGGECKESAGVDGFRRNPRNCAKFYQCAQGRWVPKDCPPGTAFSPRLGVCDWPANVPGC